MEATVDGEILISGSTTDHQARIYNATVWHGDDIRSLSRVVLPTLADGVKSSVSDVEFIPATDDGITGVAAGSVGYGSGLRAAVWIFRDEQWSQLESDTFLSDRAEWIHRLSVGDDGRLLTLGRTTDEDGEDQPAAWQSLDGQTWTRLSETFDDLPEATLTDAAIGESGMVVIARSTTDAVTHSQLYFSTDGQVWEHSVPPAFVGDGNVLVSAVVPNPDGGFVAVGSLGDEDGVNQPVSWTSENGIDWTGPSKSFGMNDDGRSASSGVGAQRVRPAGDGFLATATGSFLQHVWQSDDGLIWNPVGNIWDAESDGVALSGVASIDGVTLAVGEGGRVYQHSDGRWSRSSVAGELFPRPTTIPWANAAASSGDDFIVVGGVEDFQGKQTGRAWISDDGQNWDVVESTFLATDGFVSGPYRDVVGTDAGYLAAAPETAALASENNRAGLSYLHVFEQGEVESPATYGKDGARTVLSSVAVLDDQVIMAGIGFDGTTLEPVMVDAVLDPAAVPRLDLESVAVPNQADREAWSTLCASADTAVAVLSLDDTSSTSFALFSRSADTGWNQADLGPELTSIGDFNWINDCVHGSNGFVAVGGVQSDSDNDGAIWQSSDGTVWEKLDVPESLTDPSSNGGLIEISAHGDQYLMIGNVDVDGVSTAMLWIGSPTDGWTEVPAANNPVDFSVNSIAIDSQGTVIIAGWQDGQITIVTAGTESLLAFDS